VSPYVALGSGLQAAGHDVRIVAHPGFEDLVRENGLDFAPVAGDPRDVADSRHMRALLDRRRHVFRWLRVYRMVNDTEPLMRQRLRECWDACQDADVVVVSILPYLLGYVIAKKLQVPLVRTFTYPVSPTRSYPPDWVPRWFRPGGRFNLAVYQAQRQLLWRMVRPLVNGACRDVLGIETLPALEPFGELDRQHQLLLYCYSAAVAPPPPDWGPWIEVTGYWFLDSSTGWHPPPALEAFLSNGPSPMCVCFGSVPCDCSEITVIVRHALDLTGHRAVLVTGGGGLPPELPPNIFAIDWVPFDWLFPQVAAVVHHGGAGTTAEGFRSGVPAIIVPHFYDQFFWGRRVLDLGVGPRLIPRNRLNADALATALRVATTDPRMRRRAAELGARIRAEDGVGRAVAAFERHFGRQPLAARPMRAGTTERPA
jgi:UDP:flavonoid glycosyltransferase YjiC (YdhE family)